MGQGSDINVTADPLGRWGNIFPSWFTELFKDSIDESKNDREFSAPNKNFRLRNYQKLVADVMSDENGKDLLVYHGLGSGKTATALAVYNSLLKRSKKWKCFVLIKAALRKDPWIPDIERVFQDQPENLGIDFVNYDAPNVDSKFGEKINGILPKGNESLNDNLLFIIDESHNFIGNVFSNTKESSGSRALNIYNRILQLKEKYGSAVRVLCLSGTPAINDPFELALLFNLLRPGCLPSDSTQFESYFIDYTFEGAVFKRINKRLFQKRIVGLTSFYSGVSTDDRSRFAKVNVQHIDLTMSPEQQEVYDRFEIKEDKIEKKKKLYGSTSRSGTYRSYTRNACNFVFPSISTEINGANRPHLGDFTVNEKDLENKDIENELDYDNESTEKNESNEINVTYKRDSHNRITVESKYKEKIIQYKNELQRYWEGLKDSSFDKIIRAWQEEPKETIVYSEAIQKINIAAEQCKLWQSILFHGPKYAYAVYCICHSPGPCFVFSNFIEMEGLVIFKIVLNLCGFTRYSKEESISELDPFKTKKNRYTEYHGYLPNEETREYNKNNFNDPRNKLGEFIKVILISPSGAEGINLRNVRQVHLLEPHWTEVRVEQVIGRAVRQCSHKDLPLNERFVDVFRYRCIRQSGKMTTDQFVEFIAKKKATLINEFVQAIKESAIDCFLLKDYNKIEHCFMQDIEPMKSAPEQALIVSNFLQDAESRNVPSVSEERAVYEISVVFGDTIRKVLYEPLTNTIYDYDLQYFLGTVKLDNSGLPEMQGEHLIAEVSVKM
jgi:superfamily II DNA or RNA helicase